MAVDGFARALAFAAAKAEDISGLQADVAEVQASLETTKQDINTTLENKTNEINETLETTKVEINAELKEAVDKLSAELEEKRVKVFDSNAVIYETMDPEVRQRFDIAVVAPTVELDETQLDAINTMVGDAGATIINMSAKELNDKLDSIIGGE